VAKFAVLKALLPVIRPPFTLLYLAGPKMIATCRWQQIELLATCNTQAGAKSKRRQKEPTECCFQFSPLSTSLCGIIFIVRWVFSRAHGAYV